MQLDHLPEEEARRLKHCYDAGHLDDVRARARDLHEAGWTLRSIGEPLKVGRSTSKSWVVAARRLNLDPTPDIPKPPLPPEPAQGAFRVRALHPGISQEDAQRIKELAPYARQRRGGSTAMSKAGKSARELNELVQHHYSLGVPVSTLADAAGVTYRAMRLRVTGKTSHLPLPEVYRVA